MSDRAEPQARRYSAFLSYSQGDTPFVRKLHRWLEAYRLPSRLAKGGGRRLKPLFRDSDELAAAADLTAAVREALADADFLIVICSPRSAQSKWVGREIELFRHLHGGQRILTALIEGDNQTSFHPALLRRPHGRATEPLAADFRPGMGGHRMAFLKLMAPLAGVGLDELIHRDGQRRMRQVLVGSGAAVTATVVIATLGLVAVNAKMEAEAQRNRASGLGQFMLTDLRKGLQAAGRSDLLADVDRAALQAYPGEHLSRMSPEQLEERAKAQHALGEDSEKRGDLPTARAQFEAAWRATGALLAAKPGDSKRIFTHAQSEYWVGFIDWREGRSVESRAHFEAYARLADRLVAMNPKNDDWVMETVYSANNLGMLAMRQAGQPALAERYFRAALAGINAIAAGKPGDAGVLSEKADALAWLADSQRINGDLSGAMATRNLQGQILANLVAKDPRNVEHRTDLLGHDLAVARIDLDQGATRQALVRLEAGRAAALALEGQYPDNKNLGKLARMFELFKVRTWLSMPSRNRPLTSDLASTLGDCRPTAAGATYQEISDFCGVLLARLRAQVGDKSGSELALATVQQHTATQHDMLTTRWGLNLADEARDIQVSGIKLAGK